MLAVWPSTANRKGFAAWARTVGVRTVSSHEFGVPAVLFAAIPAELLDGAVVDGRPLEHAPPVTAPLPAPEAPAPAASQEAPEAPEAVTDSPPAPDSTPAPDGPPAAAEAPAPAPEAPAPDGNELGPQAPTPPAEPTEPATPDDGETTDTDPGQLACQHCDRTFTSAHGLRTHMGMAHAGQAPDPQDVE